MRNNLNDIIPPSRRRHLNTDSEMTSTREIPPSMPNIPASRSRRRFPWGTALIALAVVAISGGALYAFSASKVTITPHTSVATIEDDFTASPNTTDLPYAVVSVEKVATQSVPAESTENANDPAQGTITITNQQTVPQALITNTRFATPDGLIFRIHAPISVPAGGSVSAPVYADVPGDKYNVGPTTFTVPGLQGGKSYTLVTGKSDAAMTGGFSGTRPSVSQATHDKTAAALQTALESDIQTGLVAKVPAGYVLIPGASFTTYGPQPDTAGTSNTVAITIKGTATAVVLPEGPLAKTIAYKTAGTYAGQDVTLANVTKLTLKPVLPTPPTGTEDFAFHLSGTTTIVWTVDAAKIAGAVAGKTRDSAQVILSGFPEVDTARLLLRPFWTSTFPSDPAHIGVTVTPPSVTN